MAPPAADFVRAVMDQLGLEGPTDLAEAFPHWGQHTPRNVQRWLDGDTAPGYERTMEMLERAGWLKMAGKPARFPATATAPMDDPTERLEEVADRLEQVLTRMLDWAEAQLPRARRRDAG